MLFLYIVLKFVGYNYRNVGWVSLKEKFLLDIELHNSSI